MTSLLNDAMIDALESGSFEKLMPYAEKIFNELKAQKIDGISQGEKGHLIHAIFPVYILDKIVSDSTYNSLDIIACAESLILLMKKIKELKKK